MRKFERAFDRFCEKTGFDPARVLPRFQVTEEILQYGTRMAVNGDGPDERITMTFINGYELMGTLSQRKVWDEFWWFLYECSIGVYTPEKYWVEVPDSQRDQLKDMIDEEKK